MPGDKRKQSLYFPAEMLNEIRAEADRQDRSISWIVQKAWEKAFPLLKQLDGVNPVESDVDAEQPRDSSEAESGSPSEPASGGLALNPRSDPPNSWDFPRVVESAESESEKGEQRDSDGLRGPDDLRKSSS